MIPIGFMQGRLSPMEDNKIQSFPWKNWQREFDEANQNNFNLMEWTLDYDNLYENPLLKDDGVKLIKFLSNKFKIAIPSLTGDCFMQNPFWKAEQTKRKQLEKDFDNILLGCFNAGISLILIPLVDNGSVENRHQENVIVDFLMSRLHLLKELSIRICFESDYSPKKLKIFIDNFDDSYFGINYDTGNSAALGFNPFEEFAAYGDRVINIHIKDRSFGGPTLPIGEGDVNFIKIFKLLKEYDYKGNLILQTARACNDDHLTVLTKYRNMMIKYAEQANFI